MTETTSVSLLEKYFKISQRGSTLLQEIRGGIVTFFSMVYILVLNPIILSGPDSTGAYLGGGSEPNIPAIAAATALIAGVMSIMMGAVANFPIALAAGLGLNGMIAGFVQIPGMTWADGMGIVVLEGIVIVLLVLTGLREAIFRAVPKFMRSAISVGIGLFIAFIGLVNAGIVRPGLGTPVSFAVNGSISTWPLVVFVVALLTIIVLMVRKVKGALLFGIITGTVLAIVIEKLANLGNVGTENPSGWGLTVPAFPGNPIQTPDFSTVGQFSITGPFEKLGVIAVIVLTFSVMLADFFDTLGTMVAVGTEAGLVDESGQVPRTRQILLIDSLGVVAGGMGGVSTNTSFVESSTGVAEGARTGLASIVTGIAFLLATFLAPLFSVVPTEAAAPALVVVGFLIMQQVTEISWEELRISIPAFMAIVFMPFTYSITVGIGIGFIVHVIVEMVLGNAKKVHPLMYLTSVVFVIYFALDPISYLLGIK
ncbi:NCS2 family permease [Arcanobacterium phocisimile]|uniref:NCS2 family permease n=1 Tax=Arcanobacterium phocisimile TaxID=1302235 RepID=A0ABX7IIW6_9ACTO|nr:NCS2 family permease [Arcanobacterium phocisimile]QRV03073.1 NCS2 family permease [Arcanobacterium phocisimile]